MMGYVYIILFFAIILSSAIGAPYLFYKAIRLFMAKQIWKGMLRLMLSLLLGFMVFGVMTAILGAREMALRCSCHSHQAQIILFNKMYAADHGEKYPATLNGLANDYIKPGDKAVLICPASHHKVGSLTNIHEWTDYAYVSGLSDSDPAGCVVAFCSPENHKGEGASVAFIGGNVEWFSCNRPDESSNWHKPSTFQELTNNPALFYGTTNETQLAELKKRTRIIYPKKR